MHIEFRSPKESYVFSGLKHLRDFSKLSRKDDKFRAQRTALAGTKLNLACGEFRKMPEVSE